MSSQLLLFAEPLLSAGLSRLLEAEIPALEVVEQTEALAGSPEIVLWRPEIGTDLQSLRRELVLLRERWQPSPVLLCLGSEHGLTHDELLLLSAEGILENPQPKQLVDAVVTLRAGGRVMAFQQPIAHQTMGDELSQGQRLLLNGLKQIDVVRTGCELLLSRQHIHPLARLTLEGRLRELLCARNFLLWLLGPLSLAWSASGQTTKIPECITPTAVTSITLQQRNAEGIWMAVQTRLSNAISSGLINRSGQIMAIEGLNDERRTDLLMALLEQLNVVRQQLASEDVESAGCDVQNLQRRWLALQPQLREQALRSMASPYVQIPQDGSLLTVANTLVEVSNMALNDSELPDPQPMLASLVLAQPLLVDGQLLPADEPRAVLHLERLVANWLLRSAEILSAEVLACCGGWPELRRYLLRPDLLSTRNLERIRNQLNAQQRWLSWFERPIALYESRRQLLCLEAGAISAVDLLEPRDQELRRLGWFQQLVTLALESRDALAPQIQQMVRGLGDLVVVVLTQVIGRAIGLIGRGIMQGMGRSLGRS